MSGLVNGGKATYDGCPQNKAVCVCVCVCGTTDEVFYGSIVGWYMKSVNCRLSLSAACGSEFMMVITI